MPPPAADTTPAPGDARPTLVSVFGASRSDPDLDRLAHRVGVLLGEAGVQLLCGGGSGVMAAVSAGFASVGGRPIGILPGEDAMGSPPNPDIAIPLYTGMGQARNVILALSAHTAIAIGGAWGTLSEIAAARRHGVRVVLLRSWTEKELRGDRGLVPAENAEEAVRLALEGVRR